MHSKVSSAYLMSFFVLFCISHSCSHLMTFFSDSETHRIGQMDDTTWLLGNINQTGYFRVNYDLQNWKLLIQQLHTNPQVNLFVILFASFSSLSLFLSCWFSRPLFTSIYWLQFVTSVHHSVVFLSLSSCRRSSLLATGQDLLMMPSTWPGERISVVAGFKHGTG